MPDNEVSIKLGLDASEVEAGSKQLKSALTGAAQGGITGFEEVRTRLVAATQQVVQLRKELQTATDPADTARLNAALGQAQQQMSLARVELRGMSTGARQANESLGLVAAQFGVNLPIGLERILTRMPAVQAAMSAAFSASIIVAVGAAIVAVLPKIAEWIDKLRGVEKVTGEIYETTAKLNMGLGAFGKPESLKALETQLNNVSQDLNAVKKNLEGELVPTTIIVKGAVAVQGYNRVVNASADLVAYWKQRTGELTKQQEELNKAIEAERVKEHTDALEKAAAAAKKAAEAAKTFAEHQAAVNRELFNSGGALQAAKNFFEAEAKASNLAAAALNVENGARVSGLKELPPLIRDIVTANEMASDSAIKFDEAFNKRMIHAASEGLTDRQKIEFEGQQEIVAIQRQAEAAKIQLMAATNLSAEDYAAARVRIETETGQEIAAVNASTARQIALDTKQQADKMAGQIESFIDRVFLTARSVSDAFHQFLMQLLGSFVKWISQMLANWLTGVKQMSGAGAGGGLLGSILGGIFGTGGQTAAGGSSAGAGGILGSLSGLGGASVALALPGGGTIQGVTGGLTSGAISDFSAMAPLISGGQVLTGGSIPSAVGGGAGGVTNLAAMLPAALIAGGLAIGGGTAGPIRGAIGGAMVGGGGISLAAALFPELAAIPGIGWIAIGVGGALGGLLGWIGRGKAKKKAANLEQGFEFAADDLYDQFYHHQIDYESALAGMQALIDQGRQSLLGAGLGRWGEQGASNLTSVIKDEIKALDELEKKREQTTAAIGGLTLPEFALGGPVLSNGFQLPGGGIPAVLHPNEWVLNAHQVEVLGQGFLSGLPKFEYGGPVGPLAHMAPASDQPRIERQPINVGPIYISQQPGENGEAFANRVVSAWKRAVLDGAI